ncbi:class I SAM-dependent DNA methyltransferase [Pseudofrankia sp. DC12]|uniref:class I SAM-dependent DNA methyltransferase n=1 Tax=Pseudofrankia sp. DC12 TaxID=683315 RepID=UPI0005F84995|nr:class I SAM-dependent DNA methyltransferase [Pseudofrankia sp. DC12]
MTTVAPAQAHAHTNTLVAKLWNYCNVLRDDGLSTIEYVEQLSYLLFLKMADEIAGDPFFEEDAREIVPAVYNWQSLVRLTADALETHYKRTLEALGKGSGTTLSTIFAGAQCRITKPALLEKLVKNLIGEFTWTVEGSDLKGDAYEGLLAKGAEDTKTGAGQYFTPRALIDAMVEVTQPRPDDTISDPACGTGGFLIAAHRYIREHHLRTLSRDERLAFGTERNVWGTELVAGTARLAAMNMLLHGIGDADGPSLITVDDALAARPTKHASLVLANPPFGRKSSITVIGNDGTAENDDIAYEREDFRVSTTNKQLNFLQHIMSLLEMDGRAAVVLPDNVLFEGGAGEKIRRRLLDEFDLHTILRLPTGIFYAGGVKANVLFFDKKAPRVDGQPNTTVVWVYDFRTAKHFTLRQRPLRRADLDEFIAAYLPGKDRRERVESERFRPFTHAELIARDKVNLDITWLKDPALDDADSLLPPGVIAREIVEDLQSALAEFAAIAQALDDEPAEAPTAFVPDPPFAID